MEQGWIKSYRKIMDNQFLMHDNNAFIVFIKLLHLVNRNTGQYTTGRFILAELVNIKPTTLYKVLLRLEDNGLVTLGSNNKYTVITICKWKQYQSDDNTTSNNAVTTREQRGNNAVTLNKNKERRIKNNTTNVVLAEPVEFGNNEINEMFSYWQEMTGNKISANVTKNRYACKNLLKKHGADNLRRMIGGVAYSQGERFAPSIANFIQLQSKWDELLVWGKKHKLSKTAGKGFTVT